MFKLPRDNKKRAEVILKIVRGEDVEFSVDGVTYRATRDRKITKSSSFIDYLHCVYCGNKLGWKFIWNNDYRRIVPGACPCKPKI